MIAALIAWLAGSRAALGLARYSAVALAVLLFLAALRRPAERLDQMEKAPDAQRRMLEAGR